MYHGIQGADDWPTEFEPPEGTAVVAYTHAARPSPAPLRRHLDVMLNEITDRGFRLVGFFYDAGHRQGLESAIAAVETGKARVLVVPRLDRLSRDVACCLEIFDRLRAGGGHLLSLDQGTVAGLARSMELLRAMKRDLDSCLSARWRPTDEQR